MKINKLSNNHLLNAYAEEVKYNHYTPVDYNNGVDFTESELEEELLRRLNLAFSHTGDEYES